MRHYLYISDVKLDMYYKHVVQYFAVEPVHSSSLVVAGHGQISIMGELPFSGTRCCAGGLI